MGNKVSGDESIYLDFNSRSVKYVPAFVHNPANEAEFVSTNDERMQEDDECYLVSITWLRAWIAYTKTTDGTCVGPVTNQHLVECDGSGARRLKPSACLGRDFVPVCKAVWEYYFMAYGGGPVLAFKVPRGQRKKTYKTGKWLENEEFRSECRIVVPDTTGTASLAHTSVSDVKLEENATVQNIAVSSASRMMTSMSISKFQRGREMQRDVDRALLEAVSVLMYTRQSLGRRMIRHAKVIMEQCRLDGDGLDKNNTEAIATMLREGSAIILQNAWRINHSSRRVRLLKSMQAQLLTEGAASLIQSSWKIRLARRKAIALHRERERYQASLILQRTLRGCLARIRWNNLKRSLHPLVYVFSFKGADNFPVKVADPYLVMSAYNLESRVAALVTASNLKPGTKDSKKLRRGSVIASPEEKEKMFLKCYSKSKVGSQEDIFLCPDWNSQLVLSLFDSATLSRDKCLGQNIIELRDHPRVFKGEVVEFADIAVDRYVVEVQDPLSNALVPVGAEQPGPLLGSISFSFRLCNPFLSMCGWVLRVSSALLTKGQLKRRWMVLTDSVLYCFEDPFTLDTPLGALPLGQVRSVVNILIADMPAMRIHVKNESWTVTWDNEESEYTNRMWTRKFLRALPDTVKDKLDDVCLLKV